MPEVITNNLNLWTSALVTKSTVGRGSNDKLEAYGIKKLRELILELAVRGRLVLQDSDDEPASQLLEDTISEKKRLIKKEVIRETKAPAFPDEPPEHPLPEGWVWTNLYEIGEIGPRNDVDDDVEASFVPMQLISENYGVPVQHEVKQWSEIKTGFTHFKEEDVVLAKITPCFQNGKSAVIRGLTNGFGAGTTELHVYRAINGCTDPEYVLIYLKSPRFICNGIPKMTGTAGQKRITRDYFAGNHFPLPPLAEQHRIVTKVDELMALCNQLEQKQTSSIDAHQTLVETLLGTLTGVESQEELSEAWTRVANHFDTLFTTEYSIDQLKQTILQLAVMGKLVAQDPNDESASVLLEKIAAEKARLVKEGKIGKEKLVPEINEEHVSTVVPAGWEVVRFGGLIILVSGQHLKPEEYSREESDGMIPYLTGPAEFGEMYPEPTRYTNERRAVAEPGDVLITCKGSGVGKTNVANTQIAISRQLMSIRPVVIATEYMKLLADSLEDAIRENIVGIAIPGISREDVIDAVVYLPPLKEQHRIVAKVDELMTLCVSLKARIADAQTTQIHLANTIVEQAVA